MSVSRSSVSQKFLGKRPARIDLRTFRLAKYLPKLPAPPPEVSWITKVPSWPMYLNDSIGDCTIAAAAHMIQQWSYYSRNGEQTISDDDVLTAYEAVSGYVPGDPSTDNGADMLTVLKYWQKTGIGGNKIEAFASVNLLDYQEVKTAVQLFGNVYLGIQLPITADGQNAWTVADGGIYTPDGAPGSWGGHCIPIMASSPETNSVITWGGRLKMSWNFFKDYADEAYVVLDKGWLNSGNGLSPSNFDFAQLQADLAAL